uniref:Uncharacterized protein n=1 Tax=Zea mays TaxID=4577 RepID=A0A804NEW0_MAIZE
MHFSLARHISQLARSSFLCLISLKRLGITFFFLLMVNEGVRGFRIPADEDTDDRRALVLRIVADTLVDRRRGYAHSSPSRSATAFRSYSSCSSAFCSPAALSASAAASASLARSSAVTRSVASARAASSFSPALSACTHACAADTFLSATTRTSAARPLRYSYSNREMVMVPDRRDALACIVPSTAALSFFIAAASAVFAASSSFTDCCIRASVAAISAFAFSVSARTHRCSSSFSSSSFIAAFFSSCSCCSADVIFETIALDRSLVSVRASSRALAFSNLAFSCCTCASAFFSCALSRFTSSETRMISVRALSMDVMNWKLPALMLSSSFLAASSSASAVRSSALSSASTSAVPSFLTLFLSMARTSSISACRTSTSAFVTASFASISRARLRSFRSASILALVASISRANRSASAHRWASISRRSRSASMRASSTRTCSSFASSTSRFISSAASRLDWMFIADDTMSLSALALASAADLTSSRSLSSSCLARFSSRDTSAYSAASRRSPCERGAPCPVLLALVAGRIV